MKNNKLPIVLFSISLVSLTGCNQNQTTYIKTERGLLSYTEGYCTLGMLTNNDRVNILNEDSKPIKCTGLIKLNKKEYDEWEEANLHGN
jgi:hypothetical protein